MKIRNILLTISLLLIEACNSIPICIDYTAATNSNSGSKDEAVSTATEVIQLSTIQGWFDSNNYLLGLELVSTFTNGNGCPDCTWTLQGDDIGDQTSDPTLDIAATGQTLIGWEQTTDSDLTTLMGINLIFDDGSNLELGVQGSNSESIQYLGGPLHGIKWKANGKITQTQLGFNSCYCQITADAFTTPVMLGVQEPVTFTTESITPGVYDSSADSCLTSTNSVDGTSNVFFFDSSGDGYIYSENGSIVGEEKTVTISSLTGTATNIEGAITVEISFQFTPACEFSEIETTQTFQVTSITIDSSFDFNIFPSEWYHTYQQDWIDKGFGDGCTIGFSIEGSAAAWSSIAGTTISINPTTAASTQIGEHELKIVGYYTASTYETSAPATPVNKEKVTVLVQRDAGIEEWPTYTIAYLGIAAIFQGVIVMYLFLDRWRYNQMQYKSVQPNYLQYPTVAAGAPSSRINLIKLE